MSKLQQAASKGTTITVTDAELLGLHDGNSPAFWSLADVDAWCATFGLTREYDPETKVHTIKKSE